MSRIAALGFALAIVALARPCLACGGCVTPPLPPKSPQVVVQDAERVFFHRDPKTKKTVAWVEIRYSGLAQDFGWVLPLPKVPTVTVGPSYALDRIDQATSPRFQVTYDSFKREGCSFATGAGSRGGPSLGCSSPVAAPAQANATSSGGGGSPVPGVTVLAHDQAGPYDYQIIAAKAAQPLLDWLDKNGFALPAAGLAIVDTHVQRGDVFVAVRLKTGSGVNEIKPIVLAMDDADPCVPLRLTSIAAAQDMTVVVTVAGPGRAVPKNSLHATVNPLRLDWRTAGKNYPQVLAAAVDEGGGHAFVTEFAGAGKSLVVTEPVSTSWTNLALLHRAVEKGTPYSSGAVVPHVVVDAFQQVLDVPSLRQALTASKLPLVADSALILDAHAHLAPKGMDPKGVAQLYADVQAGKVTAEQKIDGKALYQQLEAEFAKPLRDLRDALGASDKVTRLVLRISPDEMDRDPVFAFHPELPDVAQLREVAVNGVCPKHEAAPTATRIAIAGYGSWVVAKPVQDTRNNPGATAFAGGANFGLPDTLADPRFRDAPAAARIDVLDEKGPAMPVAIAQVDALDLAIAGAKPGVPTVPASFPLKPAQAWQPPKSDPVVMVDQAAQDVGGGDGGCTGGPQARGAWSVAVLLLGVALVVRSRGQKTSRPAGCQS